MKLVNGCVIFILAFSPAQLLAQNSHDSALRKVQRDFIDNVKPIIQTNCGDCHWGAGSDAELDFSNYETLDEILHASKKWKKVVDRVMAGDMPPEDSDPIATADKKKLLSWLDDLFNSIDCTNIHPGRVTIRRLNRNEYRNTIRDLVGVDYSPSSTFPGDDVGYGFDNVAEVLSLPPILLEKYFDAAEFISNQAIFDADSPPFQLSIPATEFESGKNCHKQGNIHSLLSNTAISKVVDIPKDGSYRIEVRAFGQQVGSKPCEMGVAVDNQELRLFKVRATDEKVGEYQLKTKLGKGERLIAISFQNDKYIKSKKLDRNLHVLKVRVAGPLDVPAIHKKIVFARPGKTPDSQFDAARKSLRRFASRAFRRPVTTMELGRLLKLYQQSRDEGDSFEKALRVSMQAILISPHFLYKVEAQIPADSETRTLNDFELATSLSYFLWSTMPDESLFNDAFSGNLKKPVNYKKHVARMLKDKRSHALVENFAAQWLQLRALNDFEPDPDLFPGIDANMRRAMATETKMLFADILKRDGSILELLDAKHTFVNESLAKHYGLWNIKGDRFVKVALKDEQRGGLLTQASILTLTSNPTRTSPVKRGKWILENLLGEEPMFPDPDVMDLEDQTELTGTLRERMEQHRSNPNCAACHLTMDALGFSLENYDAVGRWRDKDDELPIDASSSLPDGTKFSGAEGLQRLVTGKMKDQFIRCFAEKLLIYSLGRGLEFYDECTVDQIIEHAKENDYRLSGFIFAVANSEPFLKRKATRH